MLSTYYRGGRRQRDNNGVKTYVTKMYGGKSFSMIMIRHIYQAERDLYRLLLSVMIRTIITMITALLTKLCE